MLPDKNITHEIYKKNLELVQDRRHIEQLLSGVSDIVFAINKELKITVINRAARDFLNLDRDATLNQKADAIFHIKNEAGEELLAKDYAFHIEPSKTKIGGLVLQTPYGEMFVNLRTSIIIENDQYSECVITLSDVTKERMLDKAKDEFVNIASHELRSPLTVIKSYIWMLAGGKAGVLNDKQKQYIDKIERGTERLLVLVNDYLNVARIEQGRITLNIELIDYKDFVNDIYDEFKIKTDEKKLELKLEIPDVFPKVYADKIRLREVLVNLVSNSVKFTQTGTITVKAEVIASDGIEQAQICVVDTGMGIAKDDLSKLFTKFGRLENYLSTGQEIGGTGLGLYITKSLIEKMGGKVGVDSEGLEKGSTFWCTLLTENSKNKVSSIAI